MNAARFAAKFPTVGNLKLKPSVLYALSGGTFPLDEINAIFKAAETEWVDAERAYEIINLLHAERHEEEEQEDDDEEQERALAARTETDDIFAGPPPELPPTPETTPIDPTLQSFDQAVGTMFRLHTKPLRSFLATAHDLKVINTVREFMGEVANAKRLTTSTGEGAT
jgi:hypothetical protein